MKSHNQPFAQVVLLTLVALTFGCTKDEICFPDYQDCPGEETGGEEATEFTSCFDNGGLDFTWCIADLSAIERQAVSSFFQANAPWSFADFHVWSASRECVTSLAEGECLGGVLNTAKRCAICWTEPGSPDFQAATPTGPIGAREHLLDGAISRSFDYLGWSDAAMLEPLGLDPGRKAICKAFRSRGVRSGVECLCSVDADCPQAWGEGVCEGGTCSYSNVPDETASMSPGPGLYGLGAWSDGVTCSGNACTLTPTLIANLHVLVTWWADDVEWSVDPASGHVVIDSLNSESLPYQLGVRSGDVIETIDGEAPSAEAANAAIDSMLRGSTVRVGFQSRDLYLSM